MSVSMFGSIKELQKANNYGGMIWDELVKGPEG
jgi:hypothetical protein